MRRFQLHLMESGVGPASVNGAMVGLRFFFRVTLHRPEALEYIAMARKPQRLPVVLSPDEVARLLEAAPGPKWRAALSVAYGAGLRASEVISLKVGDIDSQRMRIRVEQGKGRRDRAGGKLTLVLYYRIMQLLSAYLTPTYPHRILHKCPFCKITATKPSPRRGPGARP